MQSIQTRVETDFPVEPWLQIEPGVITLVLVAVLLINRLVLFFFHVSLKGQQSVVSEIVGTGDRGRMSADQVPERRLLVDVVTRGTDKGHDPSKKQVNHGL